MKGRGMVVRKGILECPGGWGEEKKWGRKEGVYTARLCKRKSGTRSTYQEVKWDGARKAEEERGDGRQALI